MTSTWAGNRLSVLSEPNPKPAAAAAIAGPGARPSPPLAETMLAVQADLRGHYIVHPAVAGARMRMLVDTGASLVALTHEDAAAAGIRIDPLRVKRMSTANGVLDAHAVSIAEMRLGDIAMRNIEAVVMPPGRLETSLLGMSFLMRLRSFEIRQGRLVLKG